MTDQPMIITRTFAAPRELVYAAWTTPEHFAVWFGTAEVTVDNLSMDVRVGGKWQGDMHLPNGHTINWAGEYVEVDPPSRLALTMTDNPADPAREFVTVDLTETDGVTEMTVTQPGAGFSEEQRELTIAGYNGFFDDLEKIVTA